MFLHSVNVFENNVVFPKNSEQTSLFAPAIRNFLRLNLHIPSKGQLPVSYLVHRKAHTLLFFFEYPQGRRGIFEEAYPGSPQKNQETQPNLKHEMTLAR